MAVPIENIYYLLSYSWNMLDERNRINVSCDGITKLIDLLAKVLVNSTRLLLKRGLEQSYIETEKEVSGIKGKLLATDTLKGNSYYHLHTYCSFDQFSPDVLMNQLLVTTLRRLMFVRSLDRALKEEIRSLLTMFPEIRQINVTRSAFKRIRFNRNNSFYRFVLNVCALINDNLLPSEERGTLQFTDFTRDDVKMYRLFESFVYNFCKIEFCGVYKVRRELISWQFVSDNPENERYIPAMITDITLENDFRKIIIDTKYYQDTMAERFERKKVRSANLYQLFSYLINQEHGSDRNVNATGILLYPTIEQDYDLNFWFDKHSIQIRTINLDMNWRNIDFRLRQIISASN